MSQQAPSSGQSCNNRSDVAQQQFQCGSDSPFSPPTGQKSSVQKPGLGVFNVTFVIDVLCKFFAVKLRNDL